MICKNDLREKFIFIREDITGKKEKSGIITERFFHLPCYKNSKYLAVYASLPQEVQTFDIISRSLKEGKMVFLPKIRGGGIMDFFMIDSPMDLQATGKLGIPEPKADPSRRLKPDMPMLAVVPGICFDTVKNRIGFSGGYYDRYLKNAPQAVKLGLCFDEQILKDGFIPSENHDIKMDILLTENSIY